MNANLRKEIRIVMPVLVSCVTIIWMAAGVGAFERSLVPAVFRDGAGFVILAAFFAGCVFLGIRPFCAEFQHHTMSLVLVQPVSRWELWATKRTVQFFSMILLLLAILALVPIAFALDAVPGKAVFGELLTLNLSQLWDTASYLLIPLMAYLTGPFWALHVRKTLAAAAIGVVAPFIVAVPLLLWAEFSGFKPRFDFILFSELGYVALCLVFARRRFMRLQMTDGGVGSEIDLIGRFSHLFGAANVSSERTRQAGGWALFKKELCLQQAPLLICLLMLVIFGVMVLSDRIYPVPEYFFIKDNRFGKYLVILGFYVFMVPLISGCIAMSEERASGIHSWQITLPVSRTRQWLIKLIGLICTNFILVEIVPGLLLVLFPDLGAQLLDRDGNEFIVGFVSINAGLMILSFYVGSLCRNTITAILATMGAVIYVIAVFILGPSLLPLANPESSGNLWIRLSTVGPVAVIIAVGLLALSLNNYGRAEMSNTRRLRQILGVCSFLAVLVFVLGAILFGVAEIGFGLP